MAQPLTFAIINFTASEIAKLVQGEVIGDEAILITGVSSGSGAGPGHLTFAEKEEQFSIAEKSGAAAILAPAGFESSCKTVIRVRNARIAFAKILPSFFPPELYSAGVDTTSRVASSAQVDPSAHVGPHCVIGERVCVGARTVLMGGNHVREGTRIGEDTFLHPNVVIYERTVIADRVRIHSGTVIGSDGYGYVFDAGVHRKMLQIGNVVIESDVEIGANCAIDRGALDATVIGAGTKIDNLVHIAHNVSIGRHCLIMGQVGFAGSTRLGDYVVVASQSGIAGHLELGSQSTVGAKSGVMRDIPSGGTVLGIPAMPDKQAKRQWVAIQQLPELVRRVRDLERQLGILSAIPTGGADLASEDKRAPE